MEETNRSKKFRFPGYDGASIPKAMRSSRGRGEYHKRLKQAPNDLNCIELLATVAGQVLQLKSAQEEYTVTQNASANEDSKMEGKVGSSQADVPSVQDRQLEFLDKNMVEDVSDLEDHQGSRKTQWGNKADAGMVSPQDSLKGAGLLNTIVRLQNVENVLCASPSKSNVGGCNKEEGSTLEDNLLVKGDGSNQTVPPELPEPAYPDIHIHSNCLEESDANCSSFRDRDAREEGSCMTFLQHDSPLPVSCGSSEETQTHVHKELGGLCSEQPLERHLVCSQDLDRLKARDDDDNFSDLVVPVTTLPQRSSMPLLANDLETKKSQNKSYQEKTSVAGVKRKGFSTDGTGNNSEKNDLNCIRQLTSQQLQRTKRKHRCGFSKLNGDLDMSSSLKPPDWDGKDGSVASSPTALSKGLWGNAKNTSKETHESSPVKVSITSFRVPELSVNLPETATVANLKRAVMEAAVNLLGGGLHVRVLHHDKKVYDENSTLVQMGISCKERLDSLAFMLEPNGVSNTSMSIGDSVFAYSKARNQPTSWYPVFTLGDDMDGNKREMANEVSHVHAETDASNNSEIQEKSDMINEVNRSPELQEGIPCELSQRTTAALILHPGLEDNETANLTTVQENFIGLGGKRRTRRPFTVMEVEALVQAVELLGTGRWREVKQQVFSHARHRTYVDLKDKWKTLVHTARIAPHQRRGEPVPQELLDRVLQAHTYWAMQLAKQQEDLGI
eukprot:c20003_g1_i1 orf=630-2813(-)